MEELTMKDSKKINWFEKCWELDKAGKLDPNATFACPCCGYPTKHRLGECDICEICDWEDDGAEFKFPIEHVIGGPNGDYSIKEARENFEKYFTMYRPSDNRAEKAQAQKGRRKELIDLLQDYRWKNNIIIPKKIVQRIGWNWEDS